VCSKIFRNSDFGYLKLTIERPLKLNFCASPNRVAQLKNHSAFVALAESKKRKSKTKIAEEQKEGSELQGRIIAALSRLDAGKIYKNRDDFQVALEQAFTAADAQVSTLIKRAIITALSERDPSADICLDHKGNPEADPELRDVENVPLPMRIRLPLPIGYEDKHYFGRFIHAAAFRRFVFCSAGIAEVVVGR
jgi:type I restriction enzyme M protein